MSWWHAGWISLLAVLALPNCSFDPSGLPPNQNFYPGPTPDSGLIYCDIEAPVVRRCATPADLANGIRLAAAAVALNTGNQSTIALDDSWSAMAACGGVPQVITYQGPFPKGLAVCLNCDILGPAPATYATARDVCAAKCQDLYSSPIVVPAPADVVAFCANHSDVSTNFAPPAPDLCYVGGCSDEGGVRSDFVDPRVAPSPIVWRDLVGTAAGGTDGNDVTRTSANTGNWDAGADSEQWVQWGDAYVEFSAAQTNLTVAAGFTEMGGCSAPCPDTSPDLPDISFGVILYGDGRLYVVENGTRLVGPGASGSFGDYSVGERFRVSITADSNGTAMVNYSRVTGTCNPGQQCALSTFYSHTGAPATYPLRVEARMAHQAAAITNARLVYVRQ